MADIDEPQVRTAIRELDRVRLRASVILEGGRLQAGDEGTVVHRYRDGDAFEVEFTHPLHALLALRPGEIEHLAG